jgi:hypothetical protein
MSWKISLDKYLTTPPDDGFDNWCDYIVENEISEDFYIENEDWIINGSGQCNKWLNKLFDQRKTPTESAKIIERAFKIYIK